MIRTILVPTDGSEHAKKAIDLAADIAEKYAARIVILHVLLRNISAVEIKALCEALAAPDALRKKLDDLAEATLDTMASTYESVALPIIVPDKLLKEVGDFVAERGQQLAEAKGVKDVATRIVAGAPADCILAAAKHENADMIVMGSRGLGNVAGLLMGSVSHKVSHLAPCTCVTVK